MHATIMEPVEVEQTAINVMLSSGHGADITVGSPSIINNP